MLIMILGSYRFTYSPLIGKGVWLAGVISYSIRILVFTYRNVIKGGHQDTFVPTWFVTYNGLLVSFVVETVMNMTALLKGITVYVIVIFLILIPFMIIRMIRCPLPDPLAPSSLCLVTYLNVFANRQAMVVYGLYAIVFATLVFILFNIPKFFKFQFHPRFAALTFPLAIGLVASTKMSAYLTSQGMNNVGSLIHEVVGVQLYVTTIIIGFVAYKFVRLFVLIIIKKNRI